MDLTKWLSFVCMIFNSDFSIGILTIKSTFTEEDLFVGDVSARMAAVSVTHCSRRYASNQIAFDDD